MGPLAAEVGRERDTLATEACRERDTLVTEACRDLTLADAGREVGPLAAEVGRESDTLATEACRDLTLADAGREVGPLAAEVGRESDTLATEACRDGPRLPTEDAALMGAASSPSEPPAQMAETASPERYEIISKEKNVGATLMDNKELWWGDVKRSTLVMVSGGKQSDGRVRNAGRRRDVM